MWFRPLFFALLLLPSPAQAGAKEKVAALAPAALVLVVNANGSELVAQNIDKAFVPASVTKIVTAWLAAEVFGRDYRFGPRPSTARLAREAPLIFQTSPEGCRRALGRPHASTG